MRAQEAKAGDVKEKAADSTGEKSADGTKQDCCCGMGCWVGMPAFTRPKVSDGFWLVSVRPAGWQRREQGRTGRHNGVA